MKLLFIVTLLLLTSTTLACITNKDCPAGYLCLSQICYPTNEGTKLGSHENVELPCLIRCPPGTKCRGRTCIPINSY